MWNPFNRSDSTETSAPLRREVDRRVTPKKRFTRYKVTAEYTGDRGEKVYFCNKHATGNNHIELRDYTPVVVESYRSRSSYSGIPSRYHPYVELDESEPTVISLANVESVEVEKYDELIAVATDIPVKSVEVRDSPKEEWYELYYTTKDDFDADEWEPAVWSKEEWQTQSPS